MVVRINGKRMFMWRAVDDEGEVLDALVQKRRNKRAALKLLRKLLKRQGYTPDEIVTDGLPSYGAALETLGCRSRHRPGRLRENNRAENSHLCTTKRTKDAALQIPGPGAALRFHPRHHLQSLQRSTTLNLPINASHLPGQRHGGMDGGVRRNRVNFKIRHFYR